jgi:hypothetical protein
VVGSTAAILGLATAALMADLAPVLAVALAASGALVATGALYLKLRGSQQHQ